MLFDDYEAVQRVRSDNGLGRLSREFWTHLENNPHRSAGCQLPMGWVLEIDDGRIVGIHCAYPVRYQYRGRPLLAGIGHTMAVDRAYRLSTFGLVAPFFRLEKVDFVMTTSANRGAALFYQYNKASPIPVAHLADHLSWVVNYRKVVSAALQKKRVPAPAVVALPAAVAAWTLDSLAGRNRFGRRASGVHQLENFDGRFDRFWTLLAQSSDHMLAVRDRASLQWHFEFALQKGHVRILVLEQHGEMIGYLLLLRDLRRDSQLLDHYLVVDLQVLEARADHVQALMAEALRTARSEGFAMVDVVGLCTEKRRIVESMRPYVRSTDRSPFWYKATRTVEGLDLHTPEVWDLTLLDGDATIWN